MYSFQLYLFIKGLIFVIFCRSFFISSWFNPTLAAYWKHLLSFLMMGFVVAFFLSNQENLYMIHHYSDLFYDISSTINEHNWRQTHYLSSIPNYFWYLFLSESESCFITSSATSLIMISMLSLFECTTCYSSSSMEEIKLIVIIWIFHASDFLKLFLMFLKYGLIFLRYSSTDSVVLIDTVQLIGTVTFIFSINVSPKITLCFWFIIIFFFFILKTFFNISKYYIFNYFFFWSKNVCNISKCSVFTCFIIFFLI